MLKMLEVQLDTGRGLGSWRSLEALKDFKLKEILTIAMQLFCLFSDTVRTVRRRSGLDKVC